MKKPLCPICDRKPEEGKPFCKRHQSQVASMKLTTRDIRLIRWASAKGRAHERIQARNLSKSRKAKS